MNRSTKRITSFFIALNTRYWIGTHDENKIARDFVSLFLRRDHSNIKYVENHLNKYLSSNNEQNSMTKIEEIANGDSLTFDLNI